MAISVPHEDAVQVLWAKVRHYGVDVREIVVWSRPMHWRYRDSPHARTPTTQHVLRMREQIVKIRTVANQFDALLFHPLLTASFSLHTVTQGYTYYGPRLIRTEVRKPRSNSRACAHVRNALRKCALTLTRLQLAGYLQNNARHRTYSTILYLYGQLAKEWSKTLNHRALGS